MANALSAVPARGKRRAERASAPATSTPTTHSAAGSKTRPVDMNEEPSNLGAGPHESGAATSSACAVEDDAFRQDQRRVCARHAAPDGRSEESSAEEIVTSGGTSAQPPSVHWPQQQSILDGPHYDQLRCVHSRRPGPRAAWLGRRLFCVGQDPPRVPRRAEKVRSQRSNAAREPLTVPVLTACVCCARARVRCRARGRDRRRCCRSRRSSRPPPLRLVAPAPTPAPSSPPPSPLPVLSVQRRRRRCRTCLCREPRRP